MLNGYVDVQAVYILFEDVFDEFNFISGILVSAYEWWKSWSEKLGKYCKSILKSLFIIYQKFYNVDMPFFQKVK